MFNLHLFLTFSTSHLLLSRILKSVSDPNSAFFMQIRVLFAVADLRLPSVLSSEGFSVGGSLGVGGTSDLWSPHLLNLSPSAVF